MATVEDTPADLPAPPIYVVCGGRKGQGKSELAFELWDSWEGDRVLIDSTGSVGQIHPDNETLDLVSGQLATKAPAEQPSGPPPEVFPAQYRDDDKRLSLRYVPDHKSPYAQMEVDQVLGLCFSQGDILIWIEEAGIWAPANRVPPNYRTINHMGRHKNISKIETMPRLVDVDTLIPAQADVIYAFDMPSPHDRKRLAEVAGFRQETIDQAMSELDNHGYLRYHAPAHELCIFPPIPLRKRRRQVQAHLEDNDPEPPT